MDQETPTISIRDYLREDHERIDSHMRWCESLLSAGASEEAGAEFASFREGLLRHMRIEEDILFPLLTSSAGFPNLAPINALRKEHEELRKLVDQLGDASGAESLWGACATLLREHHVREENVLYAVADDMVPEDARRDVVERMRAA